MAKSWYVYLGVGDPTLFSSYARVKIKHNCLCGNQICVIYAEGENLRPESPFSPNLLRYIKTALTTGAIQPEGPPDTKKYVYLRYR